MKTPLLVAFTCLGLTIGLVEAQTPAPVVIQAATSVPAAAATVAAPNSAASTAINAMTRPIVNALIYVSLRARDRITPAQ